MSVWVLVFYMGAIYHGGPAVIDNIESQAECERVQAVLMKNNRSTTFGPICIEVRKAGK